MLMDITQVSEVCHIDSKGLVRERAKQQSISHLEKLFVNQNYRF